MAGAVFGAILLYLCRKFSPLSTCLFPLRADIVTEFRYGSGILCLQATAFRKRWGSVLNKVLIRNCVILMVYLGLYSCLASGTQGIPVKGLSALLLVVSEAQSSQHLSGAPEPTTGMSLPTEGGRAVTTDPRCDSKLQGLSDLQLTILVMMVPAHKTLRRPLRLPMAGRTRRQSPGFRRALSLPRLPPSSQPPLG